MPQGYFGLASGTDEGTQAAPVQLFVGEAPIITDSAAAAAGATFATYEVAVLAADGTLTKLTDPEVTPGIECVICQIAGAPGARIPYYSAGRFNHEVLVWPAGTDLDTLDERKKFFHNTPISVAHLLP